MDLAGSDTITFVKDIKEHPILEEFLRKKREEGKSESLIRNYSYDLIDFMNNSSFSNLEEMLVEDVEEYIAIMRARNCSGATINRRLSAIKTFVKFLLNKKRRELRRLKRKMHDTETINQLRNQIEELEEILTVDRVKAIKMEKLPFDLDELRKILFHALHPKDPRFQQQALRNYLILKLSAIGTGARNTAIRMLEKQDLECYSCNNQCQSCTPTIKLLRKGKTERGQGQRNKITVRIENETCKELKKYIEKSPPEQKLVFISRTKKGPLSITSMNRILMKALQDAQIPKKDRTFHSLRHTFITEGIKNGTPYGMMARQVDHEGKLGITGRYDHVNAKDLDIKFIKL
ncbi:MAG: tyrosine-type recombinase/integrase [Candidatus Helarchaeales archaeon]